MSFEVGETCFCFEQERLSAVQILSAEGNGEEAKFLVRSLEQNKKYDVWKPVEFLKKRNEESIALMKELEEKYQEKLKLKESLKAAAESVSRQLPKRESKLPSTVPVEIKISRIENNLDSNSNKKRKVVTATPQLLIIPSAVQGLLVKEYQEIKLNQKLLQLPKKPKHNVENILTSWSSLKSSNTKHSSSHGGKVFCRSLLELFNRLLSSQLLYFSEREQYESLITESILPSSIYGLEHLLRLLVIVPDILARSGMDAISFPCIMENLNELLEYFNGKLNVSSDYNGVYVSSLSEGNLDTSTTCMEVEIPVEPLTVLPPVVSPKVDTISDIIS